MLKIKNAKDHREIAYLSSPGVAAIRKLNRFIVKMFRVDLTPEPIVEITLARADSDGNEQGPITQFCLRGDEARDIMDMNAFEKFVQHLEDIAVAKSPIECEKE